VGTSDIRYAKTVDGVNIAYQVRGDGPVDLVYIVGLASNFEVEFEPPWAARFLEGLSSFSRVILFDKRGSGMSDRVGRAPDLDMRADDLRAVLDGVGSQRAVLFGDGDGGNLAAVFAAMHPHRVLALVPYNAYARGRWAPDYPLGMSNEDAEAWRREIPDGWGTEEFARAFTEFSDPSHAEDPDWIRWVAKAMRQGASPAEALAFDDVERETDIRGVLATVQAPTLVLSRSTEPVHERAADLAQRIPGARHVRLRGTDFTPYAGPIDPLIDEVRRFAMGVSAEEASYDRVLATVMFTDIVGSTAKTSELGDRAWRDLLERHHAIVRAMIGRYRGVEIDTAGDGFLATFDGPARGVRCAMAITDAVGAIELEVRAGLHTGEVGTIDGKVGGLAVNIGARVGALAQASEVLVSQTVKDLVAGSGLTFEDAGEHELKGVPDTWHLYRVVA